MPTQFFNHALFPKKTLLLAVAILAPAAGYAGSYTFTDTSSNIEDLSHGTAYTWGLTTTMTGSTGANLAALETAVKTGGQTVKSATLTLTKIWDWTVEPDDVLYVNILNNVATGDNSYVYNSNPSTNDTTWGSDPFVVGTANYAAVSSHLAFTGVTSGAGQTSSLLVAPGLPTGDPGTWTDPIGGSAASAATVTITLTAANLALLNSYLSTDSGSQDIGLGFGPDCHFYDQGVTLSITTGSNSVPDSGSSLLMLACGLIAIVGLRRFGPRSVAA